MRLNISHSAERIRRLDFRDSVAGSIFVCYMGCGVSCFRGMNGMQEGEQGQAAQVLKTGNRCDFR
jgi:hypothetical protein